MNQILLGDSEFISLNLPIESIDLVFTSPPYFNAKPEYSWYATYDNYLIKLTNIIRNVSWSLKEGRFFVINISPVLVPRISRSHSSKRLALPFDVHQIFISLGFEFVEDIIWEKPEGASIGRGRRFFQDRNPLAYKPNIVTEYILVYRKKSDKLIDWNINQYSEDIRKQSRIEDYDKTNIWKISPYHSKNHPATFPIKLAEKVIKYYSFVGDTILDPFGGLGTTGQAALNLNRNYIMIEQKQEYYDYMKEHLK